MRLEDCGDVIGRDEIMQIFGYKSLNALYRAINAGKFLPPDLTMPARWSRDRLRLWWSEGVRTRSKIRRIV